MPALNKFLHLQCWILTFTPAVFCYNVDTKFPILYQTGSSHDYFGFSVGLIKNTHEYRALITAPRANSNFSNLRALHQPGVLFSCSIATSGSGPSCEEVEVDSEGNVDHDSRKHPDLSYINKRDDMWLGVSLDTQSVSKDNNVVVCGHLWKTEVPRSGYYVSGACYVLNSDLNINAVDKIIPFVDTERNVRTRTFYYEHAQAGSSAAFSEDGRSLLLGSPGYKNWRGTFVSYQLDPRMRIQQLQDPTIHYTTFRRSPAAYIGYSITSGRFFGGENIYTAVGAPRDNDYNGRVYIFLRFSQEPFGTIEGKQTGEYFGASVSGIDLNGDGFTDLLVGAPFYSEDSGGDEGKVYVYIGTNQDTFLPSSDLSGENKPNARFGTCIGNIGDLNQDGFNDVAIGAPYEDENGAVYIYYGRTNGINQRHTQRISSQDIERPIAGFGISISRGLDIDDNSYPDILIGSYASSSAVLLRTYPVIHLKSNLTFDIPKIDMNTKACAFGGLGEKLRCVNVSYCLMFSGVHVPSSLEFQTELKIDSGSRKGGEGVRGFFLSVGQTQPQTSISRNMLIRKEPNGTCFEETAYISRNISDEITPVQFLLSYNFDRNATDSCQSVDFPKHCPVIDKTSPTTVTNSISFQIDCENACEADLSVEAYVAESPTERTLIVGKYSSLTLEVTVRNRGEPAYVTELFIKLHLPPEIPLLKYDQCEKDRSQEEHVNTILKCKFRNALKNGEAAHIQIVIDAKNIPDGTSSLIFYFRATTVSEDHDKSNNEMTLPIYFERAADVNITGNPENSQIPQTDERGTVSVTHNYYGKYYGPSPVNKIVINLYVPSALTGENGTVTFLTLKDFVRDSGEISTNCSSSFIGKEFNSYDENEQGSETTEVSNSTANSRTITKRSAEGSKTDSMAKRGKDLILDCESAECDVIRCEAWPFRSGQKSIKFVLNVQIDLGVLSSVMGAWNSIQFITKGEISMDGVKMLSNIYRNETTVETEIVHLRPPGAREVEKWIIFVSIGIGFLLLLIILVILIKIGFFKRKQRERMKSMRHQVQMKEMQDMPPSDQKEVTDDGKELCPRDERGK